MSLSHAEENGVRMCVCVCVTRARATKNEVLQREEECLRVCVCVCVCAGCSLSTLTRSVLTINPQTEQGIELLAFWQAEGAGLALQPVGGEPAARASG